MEHWQLNIYGREETNYAWSKQKFLAVKTKHDLFHNNGKYFGWGERNRPSRANLSAARVEPSNHFLLPTERLPAPSVRLLIYW